MRAPPLIVPIGALAMLAHWSLVRTSKHYISDMLASGTIGLGIAALSAKLLASEKGQRAPPATLPIRHNARTRDPGRPPRKPSRTNNTIVISRKATTLAVPPG
ncbi:MAG TPA: hypothetical protein VII47_10095 [Actinomycetota bacterium]|jgi:hypothetical protein